MNPTQDAEVSSPQPVAPGLSQVRTAPASLPPLRGANRTGEYRDPASDMEPSTNWAFKMEAWAILKPNPKQEATTKDGKGDPCVA